MRWALSRSASEKYANSVDVRHEAISNTTATKNIERGKKRFIIST